MKDHLPKFPVLPHFRRNNLILQWEHFLQLSQVLEPSILEKNKRNLLLDPMPVAPAVVPLQGKYVASIVAANGRPGAAKGLFWTPIWLLKISN